jgi:hypothetical protein
MFVGELVICREMVVKRMKGKGGQEGQGTVDLGFVGVAAAER